MFITSIQGITLQTFSTMSRLSNMQIIEALRTPWDGFQRAGASLTVTVCLEIGWLRWVRACHSK